MDSIKEKLPQLLLENMQLMKEFRANSYKEAFLNLLESYKPLFQHMEEVYRTTEDKKSFINEIAEDFVSKVKIHHDASLGKLNKKTAILDYNMVMSSFVIPCILEFRGEISEVLADALLDAWNQTFTNYKLRKGNFADIDGSFKRKLCFITTAVCENLGKPDDCYELSTLRTFRDSYMMQHISGKELVKEYYEIAPELVMRIDQYKMADAIYQDIYRQYLQPCITHIEQNEYDKCEKLYIEMVCTLKNRYAGVTS